MNYRSEVSDKHKWFLNTVKNQTSISVKTLISDYSLKYKNIEIKVILDKIDIKHGTNVLYTLQQNEKAERSMRTIVETARTLIYCKNLSKTL